MRRFSLLILLMAALSGSLACGLIGGSPPEGPQQMVPDGVQELLVVDVGEAALSRTDLPSKLERDVAELENFGDVIRLAELSLPSGELSITEGDFDFDDIRASLRGKGFTTSSYREFSFLESADGAEAHALLEEEGFLISGDLVAVIDVLRDKRRESGLLWDDDEGELKLASDLSGDGLVVSTGKNCQLETNVGCRAVAWSFSRGEERRNVIEGSAALLFRDATAAQGAAATIERSIGTNELMRLTEIITDDAIITLKVDVARDDFPRLEFPIHLGRR